VWEIVRPRGTCQLADPADAPVRLFALQSDDQGLKLLRELVGVTYRPPGAVAQSLKPVLLVAIEIL
jgi:hypothetical protein